MYFECFLNTSKKEYITDAKQLKIDQCVKENYDINCIFLNYSQGQNKYFWISVRWTHLLYLEHSKLESWPELVNIYCYYYVKWNSAALRRPKWWIKSIINNNDICICRPLTRQWFIFQWVWHFQKHQLPSWHWTPSLNRNVCRSPHKPVSWARLLRTTERQTIFQIQEKLYMVACKKIYNLPKNEPIKRIQLNIQDSKLGII